MEYDPASPTDEIEDRDDSLDVGAIPLPDNVMQEEIRTFSSTAIQNIPLPPEKFTPVENVRPHLKSISPPPPPPPPIDSTNDVSNKSDPSILSFRIKAVSKRSRPGTLRTGVLPTKVKHPEIETKTELFKPTKEDELEIMAELNNESVLELQNAAQPSLTAISEAILARINNAAQGERQLSAVLREINKVNEASSLSANSEVGKPITDITKQSDPPEESSKSEPAEPQALSTISNEKPGNSKVRSRSRSRVTVVDSSNRRKRRASSEKRKSRSKSSKRSRSPRKATKRRRSKSPEKVAKRSRSRSRSVHRRSRSRSRSVRRRSPSRSLHRSRVRSPVRRRQSRSSRRRKSPLSPRRHDRDSSRSKYKRSDRKRSNSSLKRRHSKSRKRESTGRNTKKVSRKLSAGRKAEKSRSKDTISTKQNKSKRSVAEKSKYSEQGSKKTTRKTHSASSKKDERSKRAKGSSKVYESFPTENHSEDGLVQPKRTQNEENGSVLSDRVGPRTPESPSHSVPTTTASADVVTQKCTA